MSRHHLISALLFLPTIAGIGLLHRSGHNLAECAFLLFFAAVWHYLETVILIKGELVIRTSGIGLITRKREPARFWFSLLPFAALYVFAFWCYPLLETFGRL